MSLWYDKDGKIIEGTDSESGSDEWHKAMLKTGKMLGDKDYKVLKQEETPGGKYWVSTVWLGLDHSFTWFSKEPNPNPIIFETIVFKKEVDKDGFRDDVEMERYSTKENALKGHERLVKKYAKEEKNGK